MGRIALPDFKTYCRAAINKASHWQRDRNVDQWNRTEKLE